MPDTKEILYRNAESVCNNLTGAKKSYAECMLRSIEKDLRLARIGGTPRARARAFNSARDTYDQLAKLQGAKLCSKSFNANHNGFYTLEYR